VTGTVTWQYFNQAGGPLTRSSNNNLYAQVRLPAGAVVTSVELEGCDSDAVVEISFALIRVPSPDGPLALVTPLGITRGTPGCGFFPLALLPAFSPLVIDNESNLYYIRVFSPNATATLTAVRVYYRLQASPFSAVATFQDVPPRAPLLPLVEALGTSGITSGCGGGNFCPDAPLTRGQMAVFLSLGLGLHFAP
jgi:hypothetical protein